MKILIVDDLKTNILVIKKALEQENYEFIEGYDGKQAIELSKKHNPDMIIIDGLMPVMDGFEAVKILRSLEEFKRTPILMVSSLSEDSMKLKAIESGVNDFITKPFDKMELIIRCRSYMEVSRTNSQYILSSKNPYTLIPNKFALRTLLKDKKSDLILFHIDNFSSISPFYGEASIKKLEKLFAIYLQQYFKDLHIDIYQFHINYGEFAIVFKDKTSNIDIDNFCKTLYEDIKQYEMELNGFSYDISATLCFAHAGIDTLESACLVLENAVVNKKAYVVMQDVIKKIKQDAINNIATILKIKSAIEDNRIVPYFQPIFDINSYEIIKYEALVRLIEEDGKVLSPFFFLEASKKGNYYSKITEIMLDKTFTLFNYIDKEVSINLSFLDIANQVTYNKILTLLRKNPKTSSRITFEILEDEAVLDDKLLLNFIIAVKKFGVKIAIDDFGSGFSNFKRVMDINPDIIKIDGSIIKNIMTDKKSQVLTKAINDFSHSLGIKTVAEFVSDEDIFIKVSSLGIDFAQGYYISEPKAKLVTLNSHVKIFNKKENSSISS